MIKFKIDVLTELKKKGIRCTDLTRSGAVTSQTLQNIRRGQTNLNLKTINNLCILLDCQPSDILEVIPTEEEKKRFSKKI